MGVDAVFELQYQNLFGAASGYLPTDHRAVFHANRKLQAAAAGAAKVDYPASVKALQDLLLNDGIVRMLVTQMIDEVADDHKTVQDVTELLDQLALITKTAPEWEADKEKRNFFPMSALFTYMMMTEAGEAVFRNRKFNASLISILKEWCAYLDSAESAHVLNEGEHGWLSPLAYKYNELQNFVVPDQGAPHWGWKSWNDFFHREIKPGVRPIEGEGDPHVVTSPNDGTVYKTARNVALSTSFWIKGQPYSLHDMLNGDPMAPQFEGGDVFQSYLSGADYHRWHAPVSGTVVKAEVVEALMFSNLASQGNDIKGTGSQGYYTAVNTRGLLFIEADHKPIGTVVVVPVGITEVSSIRHTVKVGDHVTKGQEIGRFSYGGSSLATVWMPGAINHFTAYAPDNPDASGAIKVNGQIAVAN
ncbi:MAG: phophatidylserine decarboxylase associated domain-containing protein [Pikeienuella sp.]